MSLFRVSKDYILNYLNEGRSKILTEDEIFGKEIKLSYLKKIDKIFNKGLSYYIDPKEPLHSKEESIFFRKDNFNAELSIGAKQIVSRFEEEKIAFTTLAKLSDFKLPRLVPVYKLENDPKTVAIELRKSLYPGYSVEKRDFLKHFINKLADFNILVFEFIETHNKKEKANINGFYLSPNVIVLKRNQKSLRREIFTLAHELAHYVLNEEEIDDNISDEIMGSQKLNRIEKWCNDFAYYFLVGEYSKKMSSLIFADAGNDYYTDIIDEISKYTHLSTIALYTRLLLDNKISPSIYNEVRSEILARIQEWERLEKEKIEREKQKAIEEGRKPIAVAAQPIVSPLFLNTLKSALHTGLINEADFCKRLHIGADKIEKYF